MVTRMTVGSRYAEYTERAMHQRPQPLDPYRARVEAHVSSGMRLLHLGCGWDRSEVTIGLRDRAEVIGVDLDPTTGERYHSRFFRADAANLPFGAETFDVICSEYVFEHVDDPDGVVRELARVLRPGGVVVALTPNRWSYKSIAAAMTPHWFHRFAAAQLRPDSRSSEDVYPTRYRMNTRSALSRLASSHGLEIAELTFINNGPTWFRKMPGLFELGRVYHRAIDARALEQLRCAILVTMSKPGVFVRSGPLAVRCLTCGAQPMAEEEAGFVCSRCHRTYVRRGNTFDAYAPV